MRRGEAVLSSDCVGRAMRILKLYDGDYPWDVRVEKILRTLVQRGHQVTLIARNRQHRARREVLRDPAGVAVRRLPSPRRLEPLVGFPLFFNPVWLRESWRAAREGSPERILVRDLPLAPLGLLLGRRLGCPVILDFAEPYPEALRSNWRFDDLGGLDYVLRNPALADRVERWVLRSQPRVLVVAEEAGARLVGRGLRPDKWTLVGNTPPLERLRDAASSGNAPAAGLSGRTVLLFSGILVGDRGVDVALAATRRLLDAGHRVGLLVIGEGPARAGYEQRAAALGLGDAVRFTGWVPHGELSRFWAGASVGLLPFHACTHIHTTLANKLFDYMAAGLPVVASDAPPMARVLRETGAGQTFRAGEAEDLARVVARLLEDPAGARRMGELGRKAVEQTYCWERDAMRLLEAVDNP